MDKVLQCDDPQTFACGTTSHHGIKVTGLDLPEGVRVFTCIRIISGTVKLHFSLLITQGLGGGPLGQAAIDRMSSWTACSDGATVDTTPPIAALVSLGPVGREGVEYQASRKTLSVVWGHFEDLEETVLCACIYFNKQASSPFSRGIARYDVALGSFGGGQDVVSRTMVGDRTWFVSDNLTLSNGGTYFATVWAVDHVGLEVIHRVDERISPFLDHGRQQCYHNRQHAPRTRLCLRRPRCVFCVPE